MRPRDGGASKGHAPSGGGDPYAQLFAPQAILIQLPTLLGTKPVERGDPRVVLGQADMDVGVNGVQGSNLSLFGFSQQEAVSFLVDLNARLVRPAAVRNRAAGIGGFSKPTVWPSSQAKAKSGWV